MLRCCSKPKLFYKRSTAGKANKPNPSPYARPAPFPVCCATVADAVPLALPDVLDGPVALALELPVAVVLAATDPPLTAPAVIVTGKKFISVPLTRSDVIIVVNPPDTVDSPNSLAPLL